MSICTDTSVNLIEVSENLLREYPFLCISILGSAVRACAELSDGPCIKIKAKLTTLPRPAIEGERRGHRCQSVSGVYDSCYKNVSSVAPCPGLGLSTVLRVRRHVRNLSKGHGGFGLRTSSGIVPTGRLHSVRAGFSGTLRQHPRLPSVPCWYSGKPPRYVIICSAYCRKVPHRRLPQS